ncbi:helix-turn-helix domain-containing protein [Desulfotomaculum sp. 1211_IL3151]|uniref:helix-turn-helix domain-containing protein n=1 Tax=Desulfotomaculum sp. 1211_IL3151 TaxID=3084055 RepID=UPI002FDA7237
MTVQIGEALRNARNEKGYSLKYLEEATKIRAKYLEALENENFDILPGPVYAKAFLRTYAKYLELDTEEIMAEYNGLSKNNDTQPQAEETKPFDPEATTSIAKKWKYLVAGLAIVSLFAFNSLYNNGQNQDNKPEIPKNTAQEQPNTQGPSPENLNTPGQATNNEKDQGVRVVLKVNDEQQSWMQVEADGNTVFSGLVGPGEMKDFKAKQKIYLHVGNAGAVEVNVNGKNLGRLGENGKVVKIPFTSEEEPNSKEG